MAGSRTEAVQQRTRRKRIKRFEKICSVVVILAILTPAILCVFLLHRTKELDNEMNKLKERTESAEIRLSEAERTVFHLQEQLETEKEKLRENEKQTPEKSIEPEEETVTEESDEETAGMRNVYLTFDDGPSSYTDKILDILNEYDVKATFFVIGKDEPEYRELYQRIVEEGHTLGMHSYSHNYNELYASKESFIEDFETLQSYLYDVTGVKSKVYRFPGGSNTASNLADIQGMIDYLEQQGVAYFDWNVTSKDSSTPMLSAEQIIDNCTGNIDYYNNAFILLHDSKEKSTTVEALPKIIEKIQAVENTRIVPITEDTTPVHQRIN